MRPDLVEKFLKSSLARLQVKYVDLYLTHWPIGLIYTSDDDLIPMKDGKIMYDKTTDIEAVWKAMEAQVDAGLAKSIGISNYNIKQVERIMKMARIPPANQQVCRYIHSFTVLKFETSLYMFTQHSGRSANLFPKQGITSSL